MSTDVSITELSFLVLFSFEREREKANQYIHTFYFCWRKRIYSEHLACPCKHVTCYTHCVWKVVVFILIVYFFFYLFISLRFLWPPRWTQLLPLIIYLWVYDVLFLCVCCLEGTKFEVDIFPTVPTNVTSSTVDFFFFFVRGGVKRKCFFWFDLFSFFKGSTFLFEWENQTRERRKKFEFVRRTAWFCFKCNPSL